MRWGSGSRVVRRLREDSGRTAQYHHNLCRRRRLRRFFLQRFTHDTDAECRQAGFRRRAFHQCPYDLFDQYARPLRTADGTVSVAQGRDGDCGGECRNDHIARSVYAGRHAARRGLRHRSRRKVASGLGRDGPAGLERRHCAGPERYRVRLFVHHGRHGRPCALRIYRKPARRRA